MGSLSVTIVRGPIHVDVVVCVDTSFGMDRNLDVIRRSIRRLPHELVRDYQAKDQMVEQIRIRLISFTNTSLATDGVRTTSFSVMHPAHDFGRFVREVESLHVATEGAHESSLALEALATAIMSPWMPGATCRHVIVLITNRGARLSGNHDHLTIATVPAEARQSLDELTDMWDSNQDMTRMYKSLIVFAPDVFPWSVIGDAWGNTVWIPTAKEFRAEDTSMLSDLSKLVVNEI